MGESAKRFEGEDSGGDGRQVHEDVLQLSPKIPMRAKDWRKTLWGTQTQFLIFPLNLLTDLNSKPSKRSDERMQT